MGQPLSRKRSKKEQGGDTHVTSPMKIGIPKRLRAVLTGKELPDPNFTVILDTVAAILHSLWTGQSIAFILPPPTFFPQGAHHVRTGTIRASAHRGDYHRQRPPRTATRGLPSRP